MKKKVLSYASRCFKSLWFSVWNKQRDTLFMGKSWTKCHQGHSEMWKIKFLTKDCCNIHSWKQYLYFVPKSYFSIKVSYVYFWIFTKEYESKISQTKEENTSGVKLQINLVLRLFEFINKMKMSIQSILVVTRKQTYKYITKLQSNSKSKTKHFEIGKMFCHVICNVYKHNKPLCGTWASISTHCL